MRRLLGVLTICLLALLLGCSDDSDASLTDRTPPSGSPNSSPNSSANGAQGLRQPAKPSVPQVADCYRLRLRDALAPTTTRPSVPCRRKHTSVTFHVGSLKLRGEDNSVPIDAPRVQRQVAAACPRLLGKHLGGTEEQLRLSMLATVWFTPTLDEADLGARWFRCDLVTPGSAKSLAWLPGPDQLKGILNDVDRREAYAICGTSKPGTPGFNRINCGRPHTWKAVASVDLGTGEYPSGDQMSNLMSSACTEAARENASDPLDFTWSEEVPTRAQWRQGLRHGLCWAPQD